MMTPSKIIEFITSPQILFSISAIILFFNFGRKNNNFFNIRKIFIDQLEIFSEAKGQIFVFYGTPLLMAFGLANYKLLDDVIVGNIVVVLSIFVSMLFAILSILSAFKKEDQRYMQVLKETFNTVIFEAILCIFALMLSFSVLFIGIMKSVYLSYFFSLFIYYLIFTILLNIFIVMKRMKSLFDNR